MAVKTVVDVATTAPRPAAAAITWMQQPSVLPATVATAARRPHVTPRLTTNRTLGPGTMSSASADRRKATICDDDTDRHRRAWPRRFRPEIGDPSAPPYTPGARAPT